MAGAALLAGRAALKLGAGRVYAGCSRSSRVDPDAPELMLRHPDDVLGLDLDAIVIGPGLGQGERAETLLGAVLASDIALRAGCRRAQPDRRRTRTCARPARGAAPIRCSRPHPAEAARLLALNDRRRPGRPRCKRGPNELALLKGKAASGARRPLVHQHLGQSGMASAAWATCCGSSAPWFVRHSGVGQPRRTARLRAGIGRRAARADRSRRDLLRPEVTSLAAKTALRCSATPPCIGRSRLRDVPARVARSVAPGRESGARPGAASCIAMPWTPAQMLELDELAPPAA